MASLPAFIYMFVMLFGAYVSGNSIEEQFTLVTENSTSGIAQTLSPSYEDESGTSKDMELLVHLDGGTENSDFSGAEKNFPSESPDSVILSPRQFSFDEEVGPVRWLPYNRDREFGELPDVSRSLAELRRSYRDQSSPGQYLFNSRAMFCNEMRILSPLEGSLVAILPTSGASFCQVAVLPTEGSTLGIACSYAYPSVSRCSDEYLRITDLAGRDQKFCDGRRIDRLEGFQQLQVVFETSVAVSISSSVYCTITANGMKTVSEIDPVLPSYKYQICPNSCGKAPLNTEYFRIIGGSLARRGEYPWMVKLIISGPWKGRKICGGTILNSQTILTAAHCIYDPNTSSIDVIIGRVGKAPERGEQTIRARNWRIHYEYNRDIQATKHHNDIAILYLERDIVLGEFAAPVCLAPLDNYENQQVTATGWGLTDREIEEVSPDLRRAILRVANHEECVKNWATVGGSDVSEKEICAYAMDQATCRGDSGGPLTIRIGSRFYQIGLDSTSINCGKTYPTVHTLVPAYYDWIKENIFGGYC